MDIVQFSAFYAGFAATIYTLLDGFDLGIGILLLLEKDQAVRDQMVNSVAPIWDGNETWLVMAGVVLLAAFPAAYSILMPAFYLPLIFMLLSLGFRGVSFEFRAQNPAARSRWDLAFGLGSLLAALCQGAFIGGLVGGVVVRSGQFAGGAFDWFTPATAVSALALSSGYLVRGAGWMVLKGEGEVYEAGIRTLGWATPIFVMLMATVTRMLAGSEEAVRQAWHSRSAFLSLAAIVFLALAAWITMMAWRRKIPWERAPMLAGSVLFLCCSFGFGMVVYPYIVPWAKTIHEAASPTSSDAFIMAGAIVVTPIILAYNVFAYYVFRGKTPAKGWVS